MKNRPISNIIAIISTLGILCWIITDFYGGMLLYFFSYGLFILPIVVLFVISFIDTIVSVIKRGIKNNRIKVIFHGTLLLMIVLFNVFQSDIFKSPRILTATLKDDLFHYTLIFRENGTVENEVNGIFGFQETFKGKYHIEGDTIIFLKVPYDNDFIPEQLLIDREQNAIFMYKDESGNFSRKKEWLNHLEIH
ncbi:hypothetical protein [Avrilella dinanensis]|uniref:hypothetical protein n=1 Tax=Avrilella dinanensis TaxID=2008672 RepID=UPI001A9C7824|nr:hypothetical protein [Avrilella dinanensis]